jgi:hypothetical protein
MERTQGTTVGAQTLSGLRMLLAAVVVVAIVEAIVIGYLLFAPATGADSTVAPAPAVTDEWRPGFLQGEKDLTPAGGEDWLPQFLAGEKDLVPATGGTADEWLIRFRQGEKLGD